MPASLRVYWRIGQPGRDGVPALADAVSWLSEEEIAYSARFKIPKRRADWIAGRLNLKALLVAVLAERCAIDVAPQHLVVERQPSGAPRVRLAAHAPNLAGIPPGGALPVSVSNSHSHDRALGAVVWIDDSVARSGELAVGADLEFVEPRSEAFVADFLTPQERAYWAAAPTPGLGDLRANLVWSAKEAVLKVLQRGLTADTYWLTCLPDDATDQGHVTIDSVASEPDAFQVDLVRVPPAGQETPWRVFSVETDPRLRAGPTRFSGFWREDDGFVATLAIGLRALGVDWR